MSEIEKITSDIDSRFKSLNSVQVSDVRVTRNEWAVIKQSVLARLKPDAERLAEGIRSLKSNFPIKNTRLIDNGIEEAAKFVEKSNLFHRPMNTAERDALVRRIDEWLGYEEYMDVDELLSDIRVHLVGGGK